MGVKHTVNSRNDDLTEAVAVIAFCNYDIKIKGQRHVLKANNLICLLPHHSIWIVNGSSLPLFLSIFIWIWIKMHNLPIISHKVEITSGMFYYFILFLKINN